MSKIDVCINVYGKPYQKILTLKSLLKHSGNLIDVIYFIEEKNQTKDYNFDFIFEKIGYERFKNIKGEGYYTHAYFSESSNGHSSLLDDKKYEFEENLAKKYLEENF